MKNILTEIEKIMREKGNIQYSDASIPLHSDDNFDDACGVDLYYNGIYFGSIVVSKQIPKALARNYANILIEFIRMENAKDN